MQQQIFRNAKEKLIFKNKDLTLNARIENSNSVLKITQLTQGPRKTSVHVFT